MDLYDTFKVCLRSPPDWILAERSVLRAQRLDLNVDRPSHLGEQPLPCLTCRCPPCQGFDEYDDESGFQEFKEYVVSVRAKGTPADQVSDWVPTAILGVVWKGGDLEDNALRKTPLLLLNHTLR